MDEAEYTELDRQVAGLGDAFADGIKRLASAPALQRALLSAALNDLVWTLYINFPDDRDLLHDDLTALGQSVQTSTEDHQEMARQELSAKPN